MPLTLDLQPEIERSLLAQAEAKGVSLTAYAQEVLAREAKIAAVPARRRTGQELIDVCAQARCLLADDDLDELFRRNRLPSRAVDFE